MWRKRILAVVLVAVGIVWAWRVHAAKKPRRFPILDFNNAHHRRGMLILAIGGLILLVLAAFGGYHAYEYTESLSFCGQVCHKVMEPEFTTYEHSPHARVACVECHVGAGIRWYVRAKVSGMRELYQTLTNTYPRPIPTPMAPITPAWGVWESDPNTSSPGRANPSSTNT